MLYRPGDFGFLLGDELLLYRPGDLGFLLGDLDVSLLEVGLDGDTSLLGGWLLLRGMREGEDCAWSELASGELPMMGESRTKLDFNVEFLLGDGGGFAFRCRGVIFVILLLYLLLRFDLLVLSS